MYRRLFRKAVCVILVFLLSGCSNNYVLNLYSKPSGVRVRVGPEVEGRTPCKIEIPKKSDLVQDHHINVIYTLEDGTEIIKSYDLRNYEPPGGIPVLGGAIFALPGALLTWFSLPEDTNEDSFSDKDDDPYWPGVGIGIGLMCAGALTYYVLGGKPDAEFEYDINETFKDVN